jgi:hypothetical protein
MEALVMVPTAMLAFVMVALEMLAFVMVALGMVVIPVNVGLSMGALSKFNESSAFLRSIISWLMAAVTSAKCATISELVSLPMVILVIKVQL